MPPVIFVCERMRRKLYSFFWKLITRKSVAMAKDSGKYVAIGTSRMGRGCVAILLALFMVPVALAVAPGELREDEGAYPTADGCKIIMRTSKKKEVEDMMRASWARKHWLGPCVEGWALGPGVMLDVNAGGLRTGESHEWRLYGRRIGEDRSTQYSFDTGQPYMELASFIGMKPGVVFVLTERAAPDSGNPKDQFELLSILGNEPDTPGDGKVKYELTVTQSSAAPVCGPKVGQRCVRRVTWRGSGPLAQQAFPCGKNCYEVWKEKTQVIRSSMEAAIREEAPSIQAAKESVKEQYLPLMPAAEAAQKKAAEDVERALQVALGKARAEAAEQQRIAEATKAEDLKKMKSLFLDLLSIGTAVHVAHQELKAQEAAGGDDSQQLQDWSPVTTAEREGNAYLRVCIRDHACEDGDILRVTVNGLQTMQREIFNIAHCENFKVWPGVNSVRVLAVNGTGNKGDCDPPPGVNTGEISVSGINRDGSSRPAQSQNWRLRAGAGSTSSVEITVD